MGPNANPSEGELVTVCHLQTDTVYPSGGVGGGPVTEPP